MLGDTVPFRINGVEDDEPGEVVDVGVGGPALELVWKRAFTSTLRFVAFVRGGVEVPDGGGVGVCVVSLDDCFVGADAAPGGGAGSARIEPNDFTSTPCAMRGVFDGEEDSCAFASPIDPKLRDVLAIPKVTRGNLISAETYAPFK